MAPDSSSPFTPLQPISGTRTAWLAGSTGLVGTALLARLVADPRYGELHALVRRLPDHPPSHGKLHFHPVDFAHLPVLPPPDDVYIALGTTIKVAGSQAAFRQVDFDAVVNTARAARKAGATRLAVVSAHGAHLHSRVFYSRVKGEMEEALGRLGYPTLVIARPSLLVGDRAALGQPVRAGERWGERLMKPLARLGLLPRDLRPIRAEAVARALHTALTDGAAGQRVLASGAMQAG